MQLNSGTHYQISLAGFELSLTLIWNFDIIYFVILSFTEYSTVELSLPKTEEQDKISYCFRMFDNLITLHQCEYFLCSYKNVYLHLQQSINKITNSWEQRKLCDIAVKVTEKNVNTNIIETFTNSAEFGIVSQRDYFDHDISNFDNLSGYYIVQNDDFVYNPRISVTAPVGPINRNKLSRKGVMSPLYTVFRVKNIDCTFLEWYFKSEYWHGFMRFNGDSGARSDRFSIKDEIMFQMPLPYPDRQEQGNIGKLLLKLDNLITLHQCKHFILFNNFLSHLWYNVISPQDRAEELYIETEGDYSKIWHEHCNVCWNSIDKNTQTECYVTEDKLVWLCGKCYDILKNK